MKIAIINGSPKNKKNISSLLIEELKNAIMSKDENILFLEFHLNKPDINGGELRDIAECQAVIFVFPLYVDGVPSHLLEIMTRLEKIFKENDCKETVLYAVINSGFYEGRQSKTASDIVENFAARAGIRFYGSVCVGSGPILAAVKKVPLGHGPKKNLGAAFERLSSNIIKNVSGENIFINPNFPRFLYRIMAESDMIKQAKKNGLTKKDITCQK